jgi:hypothetical protein
MGRAAQGKKVGGGGVREIAASVELRWRSECFVREGGGACPGRGRCTCEIPRTRCESRHPQRTYTVKLLRIPVVDLSQVQCCGSRMIQFGSWSYIFGHSECGSSYLNEANKITGKFEVLRSRSDAGNV